MYEIYFEPKGGFWRIRIVTYYFFFLSLSSVVSEARKLEGKDAEFVPKNFTTYDDALNYVTTVGLSKEYRMLRKDNYSMWIAEAAHAASPSR